jgi:hypothetical protein
MLMSLFNICDMSPILGCRMHLTFLGVMRQLIFRIVGVLYIKDGS